MEEEGDRSSSTTSSLISDLYDSDNDIDINHMDSVNEEEQDDKSGNSENQDRLSADLAKPFEEKEPERSKIHSNTINSNNDTPRIIALTPKPSKSTSPHGKGKQKSDPKLDTSRIAVSAKNTVYMLDKIHKKAAIVASNEQLKPDLRNKEEDYYVKKYNNFCKHVPWDVALLENGEIAMIKRTTSSPQNKVELSDVVKNIKKKKRPF